MENTGVQTSAKTERDFDFINTYSAQAWMKANGAGEIDVKKYTSKEGEPKEFFVTDNDIKGSCSYYGEDARVSLCRPHTSDIERGDFWLMHKQGGEVVKKFTLAK